MPIWGINTPKRTGVPTVLKLLSVICILLAKFNTIIKDNLREDLHVYVDGLVEACELFRDNIPSPNID